MEVGLEVVDGAHVVDIADFIAIDTKAYSETDAEAVVVAEAD